MRKAARALLIIGLVLGTISVLTQVFTIAFGQTLMATINQYQSQLPTSSVQAMENLKKVTDRSTSHILLVVSDLLVIVAGGVLGLVAASVPKRKIWTAIFGAAALVAGLGLVAYHHWVAAGAYIVGGFLLVIMREKNVKQEQTPHVSGSPN